MAGFYTYIMASGRNGTLYVGHTDDLRRRVYQHRSGQIPGFTRTYSSEELNLGPGMRRGERIKVRLGS